MKKTVLLLVILAALAAPYSVSANGWGLMRLFHGEGGGTWARVAP